MFSYSRLSPVLGYSRPRILTMTNEEYEKMAVEAALAEAEGALSTLDGQISYYEKHLLALQERRREIINRYNLNKLC